jgi:hypothetical protein
MSAVDWTDIRAGELADRYCVPLGESENAVVAEDTVTIRFIERLNKLFLAAVHLY